MAYVETTGLLEIEPNYRALAKVEPRQVGRVVLLERLAAWWRRGADADTNGRRLARLGDHLLSDIGLTRAEAEELDRRAG